MKGRPREPEGINGQIRAIVEALPPGEIVTIDDIALKLGKTVHRKSIRRSLSYLKQMGEVQTLYVVMRA